MLKKVDYAGDKIFKFSKAKFCTFFILIFSLAVFYSLIRSRVT